MLHVAWGRSNAAIPKRVLYGLEVLGEGGGNSSVALGVREFSAAGAASGDLDLM